MICASFPTKTWGGAGTTVQVSKLHGKEDSIVSDTENPREKGLGIDSESPPPALTSPWPIQMLSFLSH
jgi:hypothetical protein